MEDYYNVTFPICKRSGKEKSVEELMQADPRISVIETLEPEDIQACFLKAEKELSSSVPPEVREYLTTARILGTYGYFQYEFFTVSLFWSLTAIEMALRYKFLQVDRPPYTLINKKGEIRSASYIELWQLLFQGWRIQKLKKFNGSFRHLMKWAFKKELIPYDIPIYSQEIMFSFINKFILYKFPEKAKNAGYTIPDNPSVVDLKNCWDSLSYDKQKQFLPNNAEIFVQEVPSLRNDLAHPAVYGNLFLPRSAIEGYRQTITVFNCFWS